MRACGALRRCVGVVCVLAMLLAWCLALGGVASADSAATAVSWAEQQVGTNLDAGLCLTFVFAAYNAAGVNLRNYVTVPITGDTYPVDIWGHFSQGTTGSGLTPPSGSLVFFSAKNGDRTLSHVAISVGGGNMVSTTDAINESAVHYETVGQHASYANELGWWLPTGSIPPPVSHAPVDVNGDGRSDLVILTGENGATTGTGKLELHALNAATGFSTRLIDVGTKYGYINTRHVIPLMGDVNGDGRSDLCILTGVNGGTTGTGKLEIHCTDGATGYTHTLIDFGTEYGYINTDSAIPMLADVNGDGRADLCLITGINGHATGTGMLEVHCANAATAYSTSLVDAGTPFGYINTQQVIPLMADQNGDGRADLCILAGVNGGTTGTGKLETHCADAATGFSTRFAEFGTEYGYINTDSAIPMLADVNGDGRADLCLITGINGHTTGTGKLEVHCANAATAYSTSDADFGTPYAYIDTEHVTVGQSSMQQQTVPMTPTIAGAASRNASAVVTFKPPISDGDWPITSYTVAASPGGRSSTVARSQRQVTVTGLTNGKSYSFEVSARNAVGTSRRSAPSRAVVVGAPGAPTSVHVTRTAAGKVRVAFTAPRNNGAPITRYTGGCRSSNGGVTKRKTSTAGPITVIGLTPGKSYTCRVKATNSRGTGPASTPSAAVTA